MKLPRLKQHRERAAMSQRALAEKAKVSPTTVAHLELGSDAQPTTAQKLAKALGIKPAELMETVA